MISRLTMHLALWLALAANPVLSMTGWWTWSPDTLTPHFAFQDPGSGDLVHSSCNSNGTAIFPTEEPHKFPIKIRAKPATPLAVTGWWDDDLGTPIASVFYQDSDDSLINAYFECNNKTGNYELDPEGQDKVSELAGAPSVHEKTGLAVTELGDSGGYRLFYHDEDGRVNLLAYDDDTDWLYLGPVSKKAPKGMSLATVQTVGVNVSVVFPYDSENIGVAQFHENSKNKWSLSALPTTFESPSPTNETSAAEIILDSSTGPGFSLSAFDEAAVHLGLAANLDHELSIFYIGSDRELYQLSQADRKWQISQSLSSVEPPEADDRSSRLALVSPLESSQVWIYYRSGGDIMVLSQEDGVWSKPKTVPTKAAKSATGSGDKTGEETSNEEDSTKVDGNEDGQTQSGGLSTGSKAGIGVGVSAAVLLLLTASFFYLRKKKRTTAAERKTHADSEGTVYNEISELPTIQPPQELQSITKYELLGDVRHSR
ncbi:hypothetical protein FZEAL_2530 [Fusarium zealandicum]|uniref:Fucose-specific lectin n=1 Tax=Fusarium zealandicum TaxID=1053134 RepID=A0A8H4UQN2_9HYPO|nr:hypothetical protein FZEAL_2530 [Fusarium zealandicum]